MAEREHVSPERSGLVSSFLTSPTPLADISQRMNDTFTTAIMSAVQQPGSLNTSADPSQRRMSSKRASQESLNSRSGHETRSGDRTPSLSGAGTPSVLDFLRDKLTSPRSPSSSSSNLKRRSFKDKGQAPSDSSVFGFNEDEPLSEDDYAFLEKQM